MKTSEIIVDQVFGKYTVISRIDGKRWLCKCECGTERPVFSANLVRGHSKSCGCSSFGRSPPNKTHGARGTREYSIWCSMKKRCYYPKQHQYADYGGRGIVICERWLGPSGFQNFLADMGACPPKCSVDRFPNKNGNYEPGNCRWATAQEQNANKRSNRLLTYEGKADTVVNWAAAMGLNRQTICARLDAGWEVARALATPKAACATATLNGRTMTIRGWAKETGYNANTITFRLATGWSDEEALTTPPRRTVK